MHFLAGIVISADLVADAANSANKRTIGTSVNFSP